MLRPRGTISTYANDGGHPVELNVLQHMVRNTRMQFIVLHTAGPDVRAAAVADVVAAARDGALPVGEEHGLPLVRFPLHRTAVPTGQSKAARSARSWSTFAMPR
ncbi:hypothetical protein [Nocardia gipuzkoensis]